MKIKTNNTDTLHYVFHISGKRIACKYTDFQRVDKISDEGAVIVIHNSHEIHNETIWFVKEVLDEKRFKGIKLGYFRANGTAQFTTQQDYDIITVPDNHQVTTFYREHMEDLGYREEVPEISDQTVTLTREEADYLYNRLIQTLYVNEIRPIEEVIINKIKPPVPFWEKVAKKAESLGLTGTAAAIRFHKPMNDKELKELLYIPSVPLEKSPGEEVVKYGKLFIYAEDLTKSLPEE